MCDINSITNYSGAEFQSPKKPRISESVWNSSSRMSTSSTLGLKQARPSNTKAEPCLQYKRGHCKYGANCIFSHDETGNARNFVPSHFSRDGIVAEEQDRMMSGVKVCWFFVNGEQCPYGNRCHFLHQNVKNLKGGVNVPREQVAVTVVSTGAGECGYSRKEYDELDCKRFENVKSDANQMQQKTVLWKTRLCHKWERNGSCPYGVKCHYAHGERELQKLGSFHPQESGKSFIVENLAADTEDATSTKKESKTVCKQQEKGKKFIFKWDKVEKISGIYADWIEMPPVHVSPGNL
ncbi:hypothetical protein ACH5RR_024583 [Cinchona calisaya]|uniref:C3H1-type domain-containing protein n=1 Tax=Cinchona calisaya TaxID=153742 RepID=A0ABD2YX47_9GENT